MLTNLYSILERRPCRTSGGFCIPYTAVLDNGVISEAYRVVSEKGVGNTTTTTGGANNMAGAEIGPDASSPKSAKSGGGAKQGGAPPPLSKKEDRANNALVGCLKKEYDLSAATVQQNLGLEEEGVAFNIKRRIARGKKHLPVKAIFVRRLQREEYAFETGGEGGSNLLSVEYLTTVQTHNLLSRGDPSTDPVNSDSLAALAEIEREQKEKSSHGRKKGAGCDAETKHNDQALDQAPDQNQHHPDVKSGRSGLMQVAITPNGSQHEMIRVIFESASPKGGSFPDHAKCSITSKRNVYPHNSDLYMGYERMATYDGPKLLTEDTTHELSQDVKDRVIHATKFILASIADAMKRYAALAVFLFKIGADGQLYFTFTPYIGLFNAGDNSTNRIDPLPKFKVPVQYESVLRRPKPTNACTFEEDLLEEPRLPFGFGVDEKVRRHGGRKSPQGEDSWLLSELKSGGADDDSGVDALGGGSPRGHGSSKKKPKSSSLAAHQDSAIDYSKIMSAIEHQFPAPLPAHAIEHINAQRRAQGTGMGDVSHLTGLGSTNQKQKRSPCPHHPRENPQSSQDALARRQQCTSVNNVRTLLQALEGKHRISPQLADTFRLTKAERRFLEAGVYSQLKKAQEAGGSANASTQHQSQLRPNSQASFRTESHASNNTQRSTSSLGATRKRSGGGGGRLNGGEERASFHVAVGPESGYFNKSDMRSGPVTGKVRPLLKTSRQPIWDTKSGRKPVFAPKVDRKQRLREERLAREQEELERASSSCSSQHPHHHRHHSDRDSDFGDSDGMLGSSPVQGQLQTPNTLSVQSRNLDVQYPELSDFHLAPSKEPEPLVATPGAGVDEAPGDVEKPDAGADHHLNMSGRGALLEILRILDDELTELRGSGSIANTIGRVGKSGGGGPDSGADPHVTSLQQQNHETIDVAMVDPSAAEGHGSSGGGVSLLGKNKARKTNILVTVEDKVHFLLNHYHYGGDALVENYRMHGRGGSGKNLPTSEAVALLQTRLDTLRESTISTMEYLYGLCYLLKSAALAVREEDKKGKKNGNNGGPKQGNAGSDSPQGKGGNTSSTTDGPGVSPLLFSIPPRDFGHLEKKAVHLLSGLPYFEQMNTEENISELQMLLVGAKHQQSKGHHQSSGIPQVSSLTDGLYCAHLEKGMNIVHCPTFSILYKPPKFELQSVVTTFILNTLRTSYLEKMDELADEFNCSTVVSSRRASMRAAPAAPSPEVDL